MTTVLALINQKGGCGKSSTAFHLGGQLATDGFRVLLVDADPQGSLSQAFLGPEAVERMPLEMTAAAAFAGGDTRSIVTPTAFERLDLIAANHLLGPYNTPQPETLGSGQFFFDAMLSAQVGYDLAIFDCPPNLYACSWNALVTADYVLVPVPPEDFGAQGLRAVHQAIESARVLNPRLSRLGHLVTRCDRRLLVHRAYEEQLRVRYDDVLVTVVPEAAAFKVALTCRQPVSVASPKSKAAQSMESLAREVRVRILEQQDAQVVAL